MSTTSRPRRMMPTVVAIGAAQIIGWGATFNLPGVIGPSIASSLETSLDLVLLGPTVMLTVLAFISWWIAPHFERWGARRMMIFGAIVMAGGLIAMSLSSSVPFFIASWMLLGAGGAGALSTAAQIAMAEIFGDRARQAIGAMSLVSGLSNTILWPIAARIDQSFGWRTTVLVYAMALIMGYVPLIMMFASRSARQPASPEVSESVERERLDPFRFTLVAAATSLNGFITWGFSLTLIPLLMQKGMDNGQAVALASFLGVVQIAARMADVVGNWSPLRSAIISTITMLVSFVLLYLGGSVIAAIVFVVLYGMAGGLMAVVRATLPLTMFPPRAYARAAGRLALPLNLSFALAPPIFARILEGPGSQAALILTITLCAVSLLCLALLTRVVARQERIALA